MRINNWINKLSKINDYNERQELIFIMVDDLVLMTKEEKRILEKFVENNIKCVGSTLKNGVWPTLEKSN